MICTILIQITRPSGPDRGQGLCQQALTIRKSLSEYTEQF